jgi:hypothetical protein
MTKEEIELEKLMRKQKKLDIKAIEFDWIFNKKDGAGFMRTLSDTDCIEMFSLKIIRYIIKFLWSRFKKAIVLYLFIPFLIYFTIFLVYATLILDKKNEENDSNGPYASADIVFAVALLIFLIYFTYFEIRQMIHHKLAYFTTFWNFIDLISIVLNFAIIICDLAGGKEESVVSLSGIAVLFMWMKLFYFGRIFISTAAMIRMIIEITIDMKYFLIVFIISILSFGNCFFILARNGSGDLFTGGNYFRAFLYTYRQALGDFDTNDFSPKDKNYLQFLWVLSTMITLIIFLNLLIAIMGDTFDRVQETAENNMLKELAALMVENELLVNRTKIFGDAKYIILIQEEKADVSAENWNGRLNHLKKFMDKAVLDQNKLLIQLEKTFESEVKDKTDRRGKELEASANKYFMNIFEKYDDLDEKVTECINNITLRNNKENGEIVE